jgi:hypothetical protein
VFGRPSVPEEPDPPLPSVNGGQRLRQLLVQLPLFFRTELRRLKNDDESRERSSKAERHFVGVLLQHRSSRILSNVKRFIEREANRHCPWNSPLRGLFFVYQQRSSSALADAAAIVFEFNADDVFACRERLIGGNSELVLWLV